MLGRSVSVSPQDYSARRADLAVQFIPVPPPGPPGILQSLGVRREPMPTSIPVGMLWSAMCISAIGSVNTDDLVAAQGGEHIISVTFGHSVLNLLSIHVVLFQRTA